MKRNSSLLTIVLQIGIIFVFILGIYLFLHKGKQGAQENTVGNKTQQAAETKKSKQTAGLPNVSANDWELVLVNRDHITAEMNPDELILMVLRWILALQKIQGNF